MLLPLISIEEVQLHVGRCVPKQTGQLHYDVLLYAVPVVAGVVGVVAVIAVFSVLAIIVILLVLKR